MGFSAKGVQGNIEALPGVPIPAIAHVIINKILPHYVVLYRINAAHAVYMDPRDGCMHSITVKAFAEIWSGVLILMAPGKDFVPRNEKISNYQRFFTC